MKRSWQRIWGRKFSLFLGYAWMHSFLDNKKFPKIRNKLFLPEGPLYALYYDRQEFQKLITKFTEYLLKQNMAAYARAYEKSFSDFLDWAQKVGSKNYSLMSTDQLCMMLKELIHRLYRFGDLQLLSFVVLEGPVTAIEQSMKKKGKEHLIPAITFPYKRTKIAQAKLDLLKMVASKRLGPEAFTNYLSKYSWMSMYDFSDTPWTTRDLEFQIEHIKNVREEIKSLGNHERLMRRQYRTLLQKTKNKPEKQLLVITHVFSYLKEMRDDYRRPAYLALRPFWIEIARRLRMSVPDTQFLLPGELDLALRSGRVNREHIKQRKAAFALQMIDGRITIAAGRRAKKIAAKYSQQQKYVDTLRGTAASPGRATGTVKVIHHQGEFSKFRRNDILVTTMTHPEFLPIMRQARAIVTNEGGITSHAAIVARELGIPCVIGTNIATKVLKNGDHVEVDAIKGIVKKVNVV